MHIVLAHDSFTQLGGAERVFLCMAELFPDAPIYTLVLDKSISAQLPTSILRRIRVTKLQWLYRIYPHFQHLLPFIPLALRLTKLPECDVLLSSSSAFAKGFRKPQVPFKHINKLTFKQIKQIMSVQKQDSKISHHAKALHINYCHTPIRFLWTDSEYIEQEVPWIVRWPAKLFLWWMKGWDLRAVAGVDKFLANSKEVQRRIEKYYGRDSEVVYPFVDTEFWRFSPSVIPDSTSQSLTAGNLESMPGQILDSGQPSDALVASGMTRVGGYFLIAGRLHAHKDNDLVIQACNELGLNLHVVGSGRDEAHLKSIAGPAITFLGRLTDEQLRDEYSGARAVIFPQLEDFGLVPVEAASCGTPTIGANVGGNLETIVPGVTGELFNKGDLSSLKVLLRNFDKLKFRVEDLHRHAEKFSKHLFTARIVDIARVASQNTEHPSH